VTPLDAVAVTAAGLAAGTVNTVVGSGSLITFPTLLAVGYHPVLANVSNNIGLVPGSASGVIGYRRELAGQGPRLARLAGASALGGLTGAILLLVLPGGVFRAVVPVLILVACVLVIAQPALSRRLTARRGHTAPVVTAPLLLCVFGTGVYGGYFGAAQGVILIGLLGIFLDDELQRLNAAKNVLAMIVNGVAAILFIAVAHVAWEAVGLIAAGSVVGGQVGATVGRRLSPQFLRGLVVVIGVVAAARLLS
jgi:uncharacterized membrane protein YfcA